MLEVALRNFANAPKELNPVSTHQITKRDADNSHSSHYTCPHLLNHSHCQLQVHE